MNLLGIVLKIQTFASAPNDSFNLYFVKQRKMIIMDNVTGFSKSSADIHMFINKNAYAYIEVKIR